MLPGPLSREANTPSPTRPLAQCAVEPPPTATASGAPPPRAGRLFRAAVRRELRGLRLGCWCEQPGPCHGHNLCAVADADFDAGGDSSTL